MILWMKFASLCLPMPSTFGTGERRMERRDSPALIGRNPLATAAWATSFLGDKLPGQSSHAVDDQLYELYGIVLFRPITYFRTVTTCGKMSYVRCAETFGKRPAKRDAARAHS
jgi:hypothetical protein